MIFPFRVALALLLDRDALADEVNSGGGRRIYLHELGKYCLVR